MTLVSASAVVDGEYRYRPSRDVDASPLFKSTKRTLLWVMLNPSTADALVDDPTIRKCRGFAERLGFTVIEVVNLFALRSTNPLKLLQHGDPIGPYNDAHISMVLPLVDEVIFAWGSHDERVRALVRSRAPRVLDLVKQYGHNVEAKCFGFNVDWTPRHPLMLPYETALRRFEVQS